MYRLPIDSREVNMYIRKATTADASTITQELLVPSFREDEQLDPEFNELDEEGVREAGCEHWLEHEDRVLFVAEADSTLVGHISAGNVETPPIYKRGPRVHIDGLYVKEAYRRQGMASSLIDRVEQWAKTNGCDTLGVAAHTENQKANEMYGEQFDLKFCSYRRQVE